MSSLAKQAMLKLADDEQKPGLLRRAGGLALKGAGAAATLWAGSKLYSGYPKISQNFRKGWNTGAAKGVTDAIKGGFGAAKPAFQASKSVFSGL